MLCNCQLRFTCAQLLLLLSLRAHGDWKKALEERDMALQYGLAVGQMSLRSNAPQGLRCRAQQCFCKDAHKLTFLAISSLEGCLWNQMSVTRPSELTTYLKMPAAGSMR